MLYVGALRNSLHTVFRVCIFSPLIALNKNTSVFYLVSESFAFQYSILRNAKNLFTDESLGTKNMSHQSETSLFLTLTSIHFMLSKLFLNANL